MNVIRNALHVTAPLVSFCITHNIYDAICNYTVDSYHILYYTSCLKYVHHLNRFRNVTPHCSREFSAPRRAEGQTCWSFLSSSPFISLVITLGLINVNIYFVSVICIPPLFAVLSIRLPLSFSSVWSPELVWLFLIILLVFEWTSSTQCKRLKSKIGSIFRVVNSKFKTIWKKKANILISHDLGRFCVLQPDLFEQK